MNSMVEKTALVVEDDEVSMFKIKQLLNRSGISDIIEAPTGEDAIIAFRQQHSEIDFIIMDYALPNMNGIDATKKIRGLELDYGAGKTVPIIALTGSMRDHIARECFMAGMNHFLPKPINSGSLGFLLQQVG